MTILEAADLLHHQWHEIINSENDAWERTGTLKFVIKQEQQELVADRLAIDLSSMQGGMRVSVRCHSNAWDSRLMRDTWQVRLYM